MKRHVLIEVFGLAAAVMLTVPVAAGAVPGKTLYYKKTYEGQVTRTIAARTKSGQVALFGFPGPNAYDQYDGKNFWVCEEGRECRISARGAKAKKGGEFLFDNFFAPYGKYDVASGFMSEQKPSGSKTVAGVASSCKSSPNLLEPEQVDTLCTSKKEGFLTLLEAGEETYALQRSADRAKPSFLRVPSGIWNGKIRG